MLSAFKSMAEGLNEYKAENIGNSSTGSSYVEEYSTFKQAGCRSSVFSRARHAGDGLSIFFHKLVCLGRFRRVKCAPISEF